MYITPYFHQYFHCPKRDLLIITLKSKESCFNIKEVILIPFYEYIYCDETDSMREVKIMIERTK